MSSVRQQLFDAVVARMRTITIANDYQTNVGQRVTAWNVQPIEERALNGIDVRDENETTEDRVTNHQDHTLEFHLDAHAKEGAATAEFLRKVIADVTQAIGSDRYFTVDDVRLAFQSQMKGNQMIIDKLDKTCGGVRITVAIRYRTPYFDPFSQ